MEPAIKTCKLSKYYRSARGGRKLALDSLSIEVERGQIFGFLGPNGAGKTTTIKMLLGFMKPSSGTVEIFGKSSCDPESRCGVGYLPEQPYFHKFMTPLEIVLMHAALLGIKRRARREQAAQMIDIVGLCEQMHSPVSKLSKGQMQRIGIAQAMIGDPDMLVLDEPASGLDPLGRRDVRDLILTLKEMGKTIFLSSHLLSEIETVCDRVAVLSQGKLSAIGKPEEIKESGDKVSITTANLSPTALPAIFTMGGQMKHTEGETVITVDSGRVYEAIDLLREHGLSLISVNPERETLEDAFLRLAA